MPKREGPSQPVSRSEQTPAVPLNEEQGNTLSIEAIKRTKKKAADILGLNTPFARKKFAAASQTEAAPVAPPAPDVTLPDVSSAAADLVTDPAPAAGSPVSTLDTQADVSEAGSKPVPVIPEKSIDEQTAQTMRKRKGAGKRTVKPPVTPVAPVSVPDIAPSPEETEKESLEKVMTSLEEGKKAHLSAVASLDSLADLEETHRVYRLDDRRFIVTPAERDIVTYGIQSKEYKKRILEKAAEYEQEIESAYNDKRRALEAAAAKKNEKEPIVTGRYRDQEGVLCDVREEGGEYFYTPLEGEDKGQEFPQGDAGNMRALMGSEWQKVDDTTEPTSEPVLVTPLATPPIPAMPPVMPPVPDASKKEGMRGFEPLKDGERAHYFIPETSKTIVVERDGDEYIVSRDGNFIPYSEADIINLAQVGKWQFYAEGLQLEDFEKKELVLTEEEKRKELIDGLRTKVGEARLEYVTTDYKQNSVWQKIKGIFGKNVSENRGDQDTESARERYEVALMKLQDAQLGELKELGLPEPELRKRMGEMLNYYKLDERISLYDDRNRVKMESMNGFQTLVTLVESVGREYNKLPRAAKYALGGICLTGGLLTGGGVIGGGVAAATSGLILMKRMIATTGLAVTIDTGVEQWMEKKRSGVAEEEKEAHLKILDANKEGGTYDFELMQDFLKYDIRALDEKFKAQKKEALIRRSVVWGAAVAGMVGMGASWASHLNTGASSGSHTDRVKDLLNRHPDAAGHVAPAPDHAVSAPAGIASATEQAAASAPAGIASAEASVIGVKEIGAANFLEKYDVTSADGKKGLWGILEQRLPEGLPKGDQNRMIQSLENVIQQKLNGMSPEELKAVGFRTGNIDDIYPGTKIDFGKLLSVQEIQSVLDGKSIAASAVIETAFPAATHTVEAVGTATGSAAEAASEVSNQAVASHVHDPMDQAVFDEKMTRLAEEKFVSLHQPVIEPDPTAAAQEVLTEDAKKFSSFTDPRSLFQFFAENPDKKLPFREATGIIRRGVFLTYEMKDYTPYTAPYDYTVHPYMGVTQMAGALKYSMALQAGTLPEYTFNQMGYPLHSSQLRSLTKLVEVAQDPRVFGSLGRVSSGETIDQYTRRIAALSVAMNKERELATLLEGR